MPEAVNEHTALKRRLGAAYAAGNVALFGVSVSLSGEQATTTSIMLSGYFLAATAWNVGGLLQPPDSTYTDNA